MGVEQEAEQPYINLGVKFYTFYSEPFISLRGGFLQTETGLVSVHL